MGVYGKILPVFIFFAISAVNGAPLLGAITNVVQNTQKQDFSSNVVGSDNLVANVAKIAATPNLNVAALNTLNQNAGGAALDGDSAGGQLSGPSGGDLSNAVINSQNQNFGTNVFGSKNTVLNAVQAAVSPNINVAALNTVNQNAGAGAGSSNGGSSGSLVGGILNTVTNSQNQDASTNIIGSNNGALSLVEAIVSPNINLPLLNTVNQNVLGGGSGGGSNNQNSGTVINQNTNLLSNLLNLNPQVLLNLVLLQSLNQQNNNGGKGCCAPIYGIPVPGYHGSGFSQNIISNNQDQTADIDIDGNNNKVFNVIDGNQIANINALKGGPINKPYPITTIAPPITIAPPTIPPKRCYRRWLRRCGDSPQYTCIPECENAQGPPTTY